MKQHLENLNLALNLERKIVGIKFVYDEDVFNHYDVPLVKNKLSYCQMINLVTKGKSFKTNFLTSGCSGAINALGFKELDDYTKSGSGYYKLGMYDTLSNARKVQNDVKSMSHKIYGVVACPLECFEEEPDSLMIIANPYQAMRIVQGYTFHHGLPKNIQFSGNQGVCLECTTDPYQNNDINVSVLCSNTRFSAKWKDSELGIGMPYNMFKSVVNGVIKTINPSETDTKKNEILSRCQRENNSLDIELGQNYYTKSV